MRVQQLQRRLLEDEGAFAASWNWVDAFLKAEHGATLPDYYLMLRQALVSRRVVLLLDGIDEGGVARGRIERHVADVLRPQGFTMVCTSRPTGLGDARFASFARFKLSTLTEAQQEQAVERRLGREGAEPLLAYLRDKVPLDTETSLRVTANPLMLAMVISVFEMRSSAAAGGGMPATVAALYGVAIGAMLQRAGSDLASHVMLLLQASLYEAHAAQQRVIEVHHLEAAALGLADPRKLSQIRDEWPAFAGPPEDGHVVQLKSSGARGVCVASGTAFKVTLADGTQTSLLTKSELISSGRDERAFSGARHRAVRAALDALPDAAQVRSAMALVIDRVREERLPLLSLLHTEPLQMQSSHLSFQEYFAADAGVRATAASLRRAHAAPLFPRSRACARPVPPVRSGAPLPPGVEPWRWSAWWANALRLGEEMGADFRRGLSKAAGVEAADGLLLQKKLWGHKPTSVAAVAALLRGNEQLRCADLSNNG